MNYTKVQPTVVKHVLQNQVMHIHEPDVSIDFKLNEIITFVRHSIRCIQTSSTSEGLKTFSNADPLTRCSCLLTLWASTLRQLRDQVLKVSDSYPVKEAILRKTPETSLISYRTACKVLLTFRATCSLTIQIQTSKTRPLSLFNSSALNTTWVAPLPPMLMIRARVLALSALSILESVTITVQSVK